MVKYETKEYVFYYRNDELLTRALESESEIKRLQCADACIKKSDMSIIKCRDSIVNLFDRYLLEDKNIAVLKSRIVELENVIFALQSSETSGDEFNSVHPARRM